MTTTLATTAKALKENPELLAKITSAGSAEERASLLRDAGVPVPTHADVNAHMASMAGVAGGYTDPVGTSTAIAVPGTVIIVAGAAAAAAA